MQLNQKDSSKLLKKYSISLPGTLHFKDIAEIKQKKIKYPAVLKIDSEEILHKTEYSLVYLNLKTFSEINESFIHAEKKIAKMNVKTYRYILQEMVSGIEFIIGMKTDVTFGKIILFGPGGVFVELLKDISMKIAPLSKKDAIDLIDGIKSRKLLEGFRNMPKVNRDKLVELLMSFSKLAINEKDISEIDFNPVMANEKEAVVVDARIISGKVQKNA